MATRKNRFLSTLVITHLITGHWSSRFIVCNESFTLSGGALFSITKQMSLPLAPIGAATVAGCAIIYIFEQASGRKECMKRIGQLEEMQTTRFRPPATSVELEAVASALHQQRKWLSTWHVLPWAPTMPWSDLPMDSGHPWLSQ